MSWGEHRRVGKERRQGWESKFILCERILNLHGWRMRKACCKKTLLGLSQGKSCTTLHKQVYHLEGIGRLGGGGGRESMCSCVCLYLHYICSITKWGRVGLPTMLLRNQNKLRNIIASGNRKSYNNIVLMNVLHTWYFNSYWIYA